MKRLAASLLVTGLVVGGLLIAPQAAVAAPVPVSGTITASDSTPLNGAEIYIFQNGTAVGHTYSASNGTFSTNLPAGDYLTRVAMSGFGTEYRTIELVDGIPFVLDATLGVGSTITGTVRDEHGDPIDNAWIFASAADGSWDTNLGFGSLTSGPDGTYTIPDLAAGDVKVSASKDGNYQETWYTTGFSHATATPITIAGAGVTVVADIVLPEGAIIRGSVVDPIGSPVKFIDVVATGVGLDYPSIRQVFDGVYKIQGLHPQAHSLTTDDHNFGLFAPAAPQTVTAVVGSPATANFVVTPALVDVSEFQTEAALVSGPTTVEAGKTYTWVVEPEGNRNVYAILYSSPVYLGAAERSAPGPVTLTLTIPKSTPAGAHKLTFSGIVDNGELSDVVREYLDLTVTSAALPATGTVTAPIGALAVLLGALGLLALAWTRRAVR